MRCEFLGVNVRFLAREDGCPPPVTVCRKASLKLSAKTVEAFNLEGLECDACDDEESHLYYVRSGQNESRSALGLQHESQCWVCHGFGHNKTDCPSPRVFRNLHEAAKISALRAGSQQSRTGTGGVAARGRGRGGSSGRGSSSARGSQRQPPGHGNVNSLDEEYEEHEQPVYSATGEPIGTMKTSEQFEEPMSKRFPLGKYGEEDLGATAFELDINGLNVMALQTLHSESDDAEREPAELPSESSALSADYVMPPLLDGYDSEGDYYESDDEGDDYGNGDYDYSNGYSLFPPCKPKSATTCNDEKQIPESSNTKEIPEESKSFLVKVLRTISGKLHGWSQPPQMLEPFSIGLPPGGAPPSPPASPPADHECDRCRVAVPFIELCQGEYWWQDDEGEWSRVRCYRCPTCIADPLCPRCSPSTAPEPAPEPVPEPEPDPAPGGYPSADEIYHRVFEGVEGHGITPLLPMDRQPGLVLNTWRGQPITPSTTPSTSSGTTTNGGWGGWGGWPNHSQGLRNDLPMQAPGTVRAWMSDGAGGHQCIGYGGEAYRWNAPGNRTPHEVGGAAGFWVSHQRRLDAEAAKAAEQAAAAARAAAQEEADKLLISRRTTTSSLLDRLRSDCAHARVLNAAARMRSNQIFAEMRVHALESTDLDPPSRLESPSYTPEASPPESPISRRTRVQDDAALQRWLTPATPPESPSYSPQDTPPESPTSTSPMVGVAYLDYSPEPRRHRPSTVWR